MTKLTCPRCKGVGEMTYTLMTANGGQQMNMKCVTCDGFGQVTRATWERHYAMEAMWCRCGNPSKENVYHPDTTLSKHHWTCRDCGKVTQVG